MGISPCKKLFKTEGFEGASFASNVGYSYKDTAVLAINPMIKVLNIVALLIVAFLV